MICRGNLTGIFAGSFSGTPPDDRKHRVSTPADGISVATEGNMLCGPFPERLCGNQRAYRALTLKI
jgi:hypothetical protein